MIRTVKWFNFLVQYSIYNCNQYLFLIFRINFLKVIFLYIINEINDKQYAFKQFSYENKIFFSKTFMHILYCTNLPFHILNIPIHIQSNPSKDQWTFVKNFITSLSFPRYSIFPHTKMLWYFLVRDKNFYQQKWKMENPRPRQTDMNFRTTTWTITNAWWTYVYVVIGFRSSIYLC